MIHTDYFHSILEFNHNGIQNAVFTLGNESLITRARNTILSYFHANSLFSHLLFLDADIRLPASGLQHMLDQGKDVIAAPVPLKAYNEEGQPILNVGFETRQISESLAVTNKAGTAVMLLSRKAVNALVQKATDEGRVYASHPTYGIGQAWNSVQMYDVFQVGVRDKEYLSEDFMVCRDLRALGFDIFLDITVPVIHHGMHAFKPQR